jgi:asparagine synthase (glutamine-hydrolysing)
MCGIAGILRTGGDDRDASALEAMQSALRHRGPDDAGTWRSPAGEALFAHNRLSIIDLTAAGHQPMSSDDGRLTIVYNGEIYNHAALRERLATAGAAFRTRSDTEVILRAYEAHGTACLPMLRGMFAFAIWDARDRTCLLARDPFGIKPLYYHAAGERLAFASEVRALVRSGLVPADLDADGVLGYLRFGAVREPATLLAAVRAVEPGQWLRWREGTLESGKYWSLVFSPEPANAVSAAQATRAALIDSVEHHFVSDVPVGIFLSGGIDSTALVALARAAGHPDLRTFSISFPDLPNDEGEVARRTAAHFGTRHEDWPIGAGEARALMGDFAQSMDQPSIDGLNTLAVSRLARRHGLKVVLSGLGGDELFAGYKSFRHVPRMTRWHRRLERVGPARRGLANALSGSPRPQWRRLGEMLGDTPGLGTSYSALRGIFTRGEAARLAAGYVATPHQGASSEPASPEDADERDAVSRLELTHYLRNQLLRDGDVNSMACGLELRVPLLDAVLVSALGRIPASLRLRPGKRLLLDAVPEIPGWVARRPKRGFLFPFERWLRDEWRGAFAEQEKRSPVPLQTWYQKWSVFMLDRWIEGLRCR